MKKVINRNKKVGVTESDEVTATTTAVSQIDSTTTTPEKSEKMPKSEEELKKINEKLVKIYIGTEKAKPESTDTLVEEYSLKVILFGYITVKSIF
jgi:hypothetical protein